jgi:hypothetical protein
MFCDQRVDGAAELAECLMRACLILSHEPAETDHIRMQDRGKFPFPRAGFENYVRDPSNDEPNIGAGVHRQCV